MPNYLCTCTCNSDARVVPLPSTVGWPPVHTSRRNIVTAMHVTKTGATVAGGGPKSTTTFAGGQKTVAPPTDSTVVATRPPAANMFAKVHMEGYAVGRKINLRAQGSYDSLSRMLSKMTTNFFCRKFHWKTCFYLWSNILKSNCNIRKPKTNLGIFKTYSGGGCLEFRAVLFRSST